MFMFASMGTILAELDVTSYRVYRDRLLSLGASKPATHGRFKTSHP
jgi:hypothetical protein